MPPAVFIGEVTGITGTPNSYQTFVTPTRTKPGDVQIAIIACEPIAVNIDTALSSAGWEQLASITMTSSTIFIARRVATDADPATLDLWLTAIPTWILSTMLVVRDLNPAAAIIGASASNVAASTNFVCPSRTLANYSDLFLGIAVVTSAAVAVTPPAGTTERHEHGAGARELEVFELLAEVVGATGTKTATTAVAQTGTAASIALATMPALLAQTLVPDIAGAIGLPTVGV